MNLEVIIPTIVGRESYLKWCIESCLNQTEVCSILVSNNGAGKAITELANSFNSPLIRVVESKQLLPMSSHWEFALSHAKGDIVTIIGDDDALMPNAIEKVKFLFKENNVECITHVPAQYFWPDFILNGYENKYVLSKQTTDITLRGSLEILKKVVSYEAHYSNLPFLYHGFVKRDLLNRIITDHGGIFNRICPDIYSDFLLASSIDKYLHLNASLTVGGQGAKSNGANCLLNTSIAESFFDNLPLTLQPKYCGNSVYLQIQEYVESIEKVSNIQEENSPNWIKFVLRVILEAIRSGDNNTKKEIFQHLSFISKQKFPSHIKIITKCLICIFKMSLISNCSKFLLNTLLKNRKINEDALKNFNANNVYDFSVAIYNSKLYIR